ncbi:MAG: preprotein translocase subunit SecG [Myxococcales bacterium]|nr:MAG: preprotein translocase subunit SecG [Myxococcales bacterium]
MVIFLTVLHVLAALFMILVVLLQPGKGAGMGAAFGGASQTVFGGGGSLTFLGKLTAGAATVFMITSISLAYIASSHQSVVDDVAQEEQAVQPPAAPAAPAEDQPAVQPAEAVPAEGTTAPAEPPAAEPPAEQAPAPAENQPAEGGAPQP